MESNSTGSFGPKSKQLILDAQRTGLKVVVCDRYATIVKNANNGVKLYRDGRSIMMGIDLETARSMNTMEVRQFLGIAR